MLVYWAVITTAYLTYVRIGRLDHEVVKKDCYAYKLLKKNCLRFVGAEFFKTINPNRSLR